MSVHMCVFCMPKALSAKGMREMFCVDVGVRYCTVLCGCWCQVFHCFVWMSVSGISQFCAVCVRCFTVLCGWLCQVFHSFVLSGISQFCVVCVRYFNWATAAPMVLCEMAFNKPLPEVRQDILGVVLTCHVLCFNHFLSLFLKYVSIPVLVSTHF